MYTYSFLDKILLVFYNSGYLLLELAPYMVVGVIIGELLKFTSWTELMVKGLGKSPVLSVLFAAVLGAVSPLCTYGTIPVVLQLYRAGINISPLITFLAVSSMMNPQLFFITWGGLGAEIALVRLLAVLAFGFVLGMILYRIPIRLIVNSGVKTDFTNGRKETLVGKFNTRTLFRNCVKTIQFIGFYMVMGVILSAVIDVFIPKAWLQGVFAGNSFFAVLKAAFMGVPLYACGGGVIAVIREFMSAGMGKGAAMAFLLVGPATRITPLMALAAILRPIFIVLYTLLLIAYSLLIGMIYH